MSDARTKAERSLAKDKRQGVVDQKPVHAKDKKHKKPYAVVGSIWMWKDFAIGHYFTLKDAEKALENYQKKALYSNLRIEGPK